MSVVVCLPEPEARKRLMDLLPRDAADRQVHIVEAWPGSVTIERIAKSKDHRDWAFGYVLDIVGVFPESVAGMLFRIPPDEAAALHAEHKAAMCAREAELHASGEERPL